MVEKCVLPFTKQLSSRLSLKVTFRQMLQDLLIFCLDLFHRSTCFPLRLFISGEIGRENAVYRHTLEGERHVGDHYIRKR